MELRKTVRELNGTVRDPKLLALRASMSEASWSHRVAAAMVKERLLLAVLERVEAGSTFGAAVRLAAPHHGAADVERWWSRYAEAGLEGLVSRSGNVIERRDSPRPRAPTYRNGKPKISFLRWAGSKSPVREVILGLLPDEFGVYHEPMAGAATVFFSLDPPVARLSDSNRELMSCFSVVRDRVDDLLRALEGHENTFEHYHAIRRQDPWALPEVERAARTIFLNKVGFNGLYRQNNAGEFNVPYGRRSATRLVDETTLRSCSARLARSELTACDFEDAASMVVAGDLVYFDPPYLPEGRARSFSYGAGGFSVSDHERLAAVARALAERDAYVFVSNADVPKIRELYAGFHFEVLSVRRSIAANATFRGQRNELLIFSGPDRFSGRRAGPRKGLSATAQRSATVSATVGQSATVERSATVEPRATPSTRRARHEQRVEALRQLKSSRAPEARLESKEGPTRRAPSAGQDQLVHEVALALFGLGRLERRVALRELDRVLGELPGVESGSAARAYRIAEALQHAVWAGLVESAPWGFVRAIRPDPATYLASEWDLCIAAVASDEPRERAELVTAGWEFAVRVLGLVSSAPIRGSLVFERLSLSVDRAVRQGSLLRVGRLGFRRPTQGSP